MKIARTKNAVRNTIYGWISTIISMLFPFVVRMIITRILGVEYLGINSLFTSVLIILNLSELGVGSAIVYSMYKPIAHDDEQAICALLNLYRKIYRIIGIIVFTAGMIIMPFLPHFIKGEAPAGYNLYILFFIYLVNATSSYWLFAYRTSLLYAHQKNEVVSKVGILCTILLNTLQILMLVVTKNYYCYLIVMPLVTILNNILNAYFAKKMYPQYDCRGTVPAEVMKGIRKRVAGLMFDKVATASRNAFDSVIVSSFIGLQIVAIYNNYYYVIGAITGMMSVILNSIAAGIGNSLVMESREKNETDLKTISFLFLSLAGCAFCFFLVLFQPFMELWMGKENMFPETVMIAFSVYFLAQKTESIIGRYYDAAGLWWHGRWKGVTEALVNITLNVVLCKLFGVIGIVAATIISILFVALPIAAHFFYKHTLQKKPLDYLFRQYRNFLLFCVIGLANYKIVETVIRAFGTENLYLAMIIRAVLAFVLFAVMYLAVFSWQKQFKTSFSWLKDHAGLLLRRKQAEGAADHAGTER